jgi:broad specificity phosphatase PhoE
MRILLIRHGRSAFAHRGGLIDRRGVERWRDEYDAAGIASADQPPSELVAEVASAHVVAASDAPRALTSAERLAPGRLIVTSPLFREIPLVVPAFETLRAPLAVWGTLIHLRWVMDIMAGRDATAVAREQARMAAEWCLEKCRERGVVDAGLVVVTHGVFRRMLAGELRTMGWRFETLRRSYAHWSVWRLAQPSP